MYGDNVHTKKTANKYRGESVFSSAVFFFSIHFFFLNIAKGCNVFTLTAQTHNGKHVIYSRERVNITNNARTDASMADKRNVFCRRSARWNFAVVLPRTRYFASIFDCVGCIINRISALSRSVMTSRTNRSREVFKLFLLSRKFYYFKLG